MRYIWDLYDDYFGHLMKTLEEEGILENTVVVFSSDHGDQLGSHQFYGKNTPFAESTSIPFLLRYPKAVKAETESAQPIAIPAQPAEAVPALPMAQGRSMEPNT